MARITGGRSLENSYWVVDREILAGEYPRTKEPDSSRERLGALLDFGVRLFIDLTEPGESGLIPYHDMLAEIAAARGVEAEHRRLSIRDVSIPHSPERMTEILDTMDEARQSGLLVYLHCWGGTGRTGTVIGCYYRRHGRSHDEALTELRSRWGTMAKAPFKKGTPDTREQEEYIRDWPGLDPRLS